MDPEVERLAQRIVAEFKTTSPDRRFLIAVAGRPGSGKSTLAYPLTDRLNQLLGKAPFHPSHLDPQTDIASPAPEAGTEGETAICVGLDGWHYSRAELDAMDDPVEAHWRRGAAFTFNLPSYLTFLQQLRLPLAPNPPRSIPFPTFDHQVKDPAISPHPILPRHRIVIVEGLYTMLDREGWRQCAEMMDARVWVECDRAVCRRRTIKRNFAAGIVDSIEKCEHRVDASDVVNGDEVADHKYRPTEIIYCVDSEALTNGSSSSSTTTTTTNGHVKGNGLANGH